MRGGLWCASFMPKRRKRPPKVAKAPTKATMTSHQICQIMPNPPKVAKALISFERMMKYWKFWSSSRACDARREPSCWM